MLGILRVFFAKVLFSKKNELVSIPGFINFFILKINYFLPHYTFYELEQLK